MVSVNGRSTVVVGDNSLDERIYLQTILQSAGFTVRLAENGEEVLSLLQDERSVSLVLLDEWMPVRDGLETLRELRRRHNSLPVIFMSQLPVAESIQEAIKEHKATLLEKPLLPESLNIALASNLHFERSAQQKYPTLSVVQEEKIAPNSYLSKMDNLIKQVGCSEVPVLLRGETGVGKEVLAQQIHSCSRRARKPFVKINCAALPSELVESELFGYERGAFSGAYMQSPGLFETANEGTILLDEIGDMDVRLQAKLLQVLQDGEFRRLGGREMLRVDVRVMAASHQNLREAIKQGQFREDLYYRLNVVNIRIPPLRERREEILPLAEHFLRKHRTPDSPMLTILPYLRDTMLGYDWPGNVRELENAIRRYLVFQDPVKLADELRGENLSRRPVEHIDAPGIPKAEKGHSDRASALALVDQSKRAAETKAILGALETTYWNRKRAAQLLKIDYRALLYKMKKLHITDESSAKTKPPDVENRKISSSAATG